MDTFKKLLRLLYEIYLIVKERLFLISPPGHQPPRPSSFTGAGMGEADFQLEYQAAEKQLFQPSPVFASVNGEMQAGDRAGDFKASSLLEDQHISLCETLDRLLNTGVVIHGDITISVANIDLIYIGLRALLTSVETARQSGINHMTDF